MSPPSPRATRSSQSASGTAAPPTLKVELWPIERPVPCGDNPRLCPPAAIEKVSESLKAYGFRQPIVVDREGVIIAGHTRLLAAQKLGLAQVPVHVADLTPEQARAYRLADNRTNEETSWNADLLASEIGALAEIDYDLSILGFDGDELAEILGLTSAGLTHPDLVPEPPQEPLSKPGDLWILGEHRLLCGDATKTEDVERLMAGERACLMVTDPPYLVNYTGGSHPATQANGGKAGQDPDKHWDTYIDHEHSVEFYVAFLSAALKGALSADAAIYQCYAIMRSELIWAAWRSVGLLAHQTLIWRKSRSVLSYSWYMWDYEPILVGWPAGHQPKRHPPADAKAVWEIASTIEDGAGQIHPTMKPVELYRRPISYHTKVGEAIYEPFCGSGTALIAAEMSGRRCRAIELSPAFCDVAITRWCNFSGRAAVRHE
jgi:DNA modification methylase